MGSETLGQWLKERCRREHLSLRQAGVRAGLSFATVAKVIKTGRASPETIRKLAQGFGGGLALEDHLLVLAGYRSKPQGELTYLKAIPLLSPEHQHIIEVLVREFAKTEGIKVRRQKVNSGKGSIKILDA